MHSTCMHTWSPIKSEPAIAVIEMLHASCRHEEVVQKLSILTAENQTFKLQLDQTQFKNEELFKALQGAQGSARWGISDTPHSMVLVVPVPFSWCSPLVPHDGSWHGEEHCYDNLSVQALRYSKLQMCCMFQDPK